MTSAIDLLDLFVEQYVDTNQLSAVGIQKAANVLIRAQRSIDHPALTDETAGADNGADDHDPILADCEELTQSLCDLKEPIPKGLETSELRLRLLSDKDFELLCLLVETRQLRAIVEKQWRQIFCWIPLFKMPRQLQQQVFNMVNLDHFYRTQDPLPPWMVALKSMWRNYTQQHVHAGYHQLQKAYFPNNIDDALPAFIMQHRQLEANVERLSEYCDKLSGSKALPPDKNLIMRTQESILWARRRLQAVKEKAAVWYWRSRDAKITKELPGASFSLAYGEKVVVDFERDTIRILQLDHMNQPLWLSHGSRFTPLRWKPGTPWIDWTVNEKQGHPALVRDRKLNSLGVETKPTPSYEVRVPQTLINILLGFGDTYAAAVIPEDDDLTAEQHAKMRQRREDKAKSLSRATGEDYWRVQALKKSVTRVNLAFDANLEYDNTIEKLYEKRAQLDSVGNMTLHQMMIMFNEMHHPHQPQQNFIVSNQPVYVFSSEPEHEDQETSETS